LSTQANSKVIHSRRLRENGLSILVGAKTTAVDNFFVALDNVKDPKKVTNIHPLILEKTQIFFPNHDNSGKLAIDEV